MNLRRSRFCRIWHFDTGLESVEQRITQVALKGKNEMTNLRKFAKGQDCKVRLPGICNFNPETTVLAHLPGAGMALKHPDILGAHCCSDCHAVIDGARKTDLERDFVRMCLYEGVFRTQRVLIAEGVLSW